MLSRKLNHKNDENDEEREPLVGHKSSLSLSSGKKFQQQQQQRTPSAFLFCKDVTRAIIYLIWKLRYFFVICFLLFAFFILIVSSFRMSNVMEIVAHPSSFSDYWNQFRHSVDSIGQDSDLLHTLKGTQPIAYTKEDKLRLDGMNNPDHLVWGSTGKQPCVKVNESYLLMVLNTQSAISENMDNFVKMCADENHFIVSHTSDFLPSNPTTLSEVIEKEETMTSYFRFLNFKSIYIYIYMHMYVRDIL